MFESLMPWWIGDLPLDPDPEFLNNAELAALAPDAWAACGYTQLDGGELFAWSRYQNTVNAFYWDGNSPTLTWWPITDTKANVMSLSPSQV